jgi:hypothetical protein
MLAPRTLVDDFLPDADSDDTEITPSTLVRPDLDDAEAYYNMGRADDAELALNRAAAKYRLLDLPNTSLRYRKLSGLVAGMRVSKIPLTTEA